VIAAGIVMITLAPGALERVSAATYAAGAMILFAASAAFHLARHDGVRRVLGRVDHGAILVLVAATYTPFVLLGLDGVRRIALITVIWAAASAGVLVRAIWADPPRWLLVALTLALGWAAVPFLPDLLAGAGVAAVILAASGGAAYSAGAAVYAARRPDPWPAVFGFHEVFHLLTVAAFAAQNVGVWLLVLGG
jgi:hemolysin III